MNWRSAVTIPAVMAGCYYGLVLLAALRRRGTGPTAPESLPPISILKPVYGADDRLAEAIASHARQDYPEFELLLGIRESDAASMDLVRRAQQEFPEGAIRAVTVQTAMPNGKAGALHDLAAAARYPILVINDADIRVEPGYLREIAGLLSNPQTGLVTALYRATGESFATRFEALGVATEFAPSVLVARLLGVAEFALGSTMAVRARDLERIGGFHDIGEYLADDYQLGLRVTQLGLHVAFAETVVETGLGDSGWMGVWKHQVRWSRTIRVSRPSGYYGYVITQATFWACVAAAAGNWSVALTVVALRMVAGFAVAGLVLKDRKSMALGWMMPVRDLFGFAVWVAAGFGRTVEWRGARLRLSRDGRIVQEG